MTALKETLPNFCTTIHSSTQTLQNFFKRYTTLEQTVSNFENLLVESSPIVVNLTYLPKPIAAVFHKSTVTTAL